MPYFKTPCQSIQPLLLQTAARARTLAEWMTGRSRGAGLREIDREATRIGSKLSPEDIGIVRTSTMGEAIAKTGIASIDEDTDPQ